MAKQKYEKDENEERLKRETELIKKKLLEQGAYFGNSDQQGDLPPEIENEFYKNILEFENAHKNAKLVPVYDFIGKPKYKKELELSDTQILPELERIMDIMDENSVSIDSIYDVDDRTFYKFITEELFLHEIENVRNKGMYLNFTYEEFHPNHENYIREHCLDFVASFLQKDTIIYTSFLTNEYEKDKWLNNFQDSFSSFSLHHFEIKSLTFNEQDANVIFNIDFSGTIEGGNEQQRFTGEGKADLVFQYGYWVINKVSFPMNR